MCRRAILDPDMDFPRHPGSWQLPELSERCSQHFHGILFHSHVWLLPWPFRVRSRVLSQLRRLHSQGGSPLPEGLTQLFLHRPMRAWEPHGRIHRASVMQHPEKPGWVETKNSHALGKLTRCLVSFSAPCLPADYMPASPGFLVTSFYIFKGIKMS